MVSFTFKPKKVYLFSSSRSICSCSVRSRSESSAIWRDGLSFDTIHGLWAYLVLECPFFVLCEVLDSILP